jgi:hypothetical protein
MQNIGFMVIFPTKRNKDLLRTITTKFEVVAILQQKNKKQQLWQYFTKC